ncbi:MAG: glycosyltransferase family 4 protein [Alishewanella agri]|nr:glycosyltransferase family 4 protein [Alishewanella agri]
MSILLLSEIFPPKHGGSGRWFFELYRRLTPGSVTILTHDNQDPEQQQIDKAYPQPIIRQPMTSKSWGLKSITGLGFYGRMLYQALKHKPANLSQIHCGRTIHEGFTGLILSKLLRKPLICYVHGEDIEVARSSRELAFMVRQVLKGSTKLICNSNNTKNLLVEHWQMPVDKIAVLHPGVDEQRFVPVPADDTFREQQGWQQRIVCLTVGRLQKRKGHDRMIMALPQIVAKYPQFLYVIVGNGEELPTLKQLVQQYKVEPYVQFKAEITDAELIQCYQQCDLFILPNRTEGNDIEGFGMVLVEAQAAGKPVIAGDSGGTRETMLVGTTGLIADCTSAQAIAAAVAELLTIRSAERFSATQCRQHVLENYTWQQHTGRASALFDSIAAGRCE